MFSRAISMRAPKKLNSFYKKLNIKTSHLSINFEPNLTIKKNNMVNFKSLIISKNKTPYSLKRNLMKRTLSTQQYQTEKGRMVFLERHEQLKAVAMF